MKIPSDRFSSSASFPDHHRVVSRPWLYVEIPEAETDPELLNASVEDLNAALMAAFAGRRALAEPISYARSAETAS